MGKSLSDMYGECTDKTQIRFEICDACWPENDTPEKRRAAAIQRARALSMLVVFYLTAVFLGIPVVRAFLPDTPVRTVAYALAPLALFVLAALTVAVLAWVVRACRLIFGTVSTKDFE